MASKVFKIKYEAYDNGRKYPMWVSLQLGIIAVIVGFGGIADEVVGWIVIGCIVLFLPFKYLNYRAEFYRR